MTLLCIWVQWTYSIMIQGHAQRGQLAACARLHAEMRDAGVPPSAILYNTLLWAAMRAAGQQRSWPLQLKVGEPVRRLQHISAV